MSADPQLLAALRPVLERHPEVRLALLFGSRARGVAVPEADLDLAVEGVRGEDLDRPWYERMRDAYLRRLAAEAHG